MSKSRIALSWSGGKDSMIALNALLDSGKYEISALVSTVTEEHDRISMHGVRRDLLEQQAEALGIPLEIAWIPANCTNEDYERRFGEALARCRSRGIGSAAAGDIFLEDVRAYRQELFAKHEIEPVFPIWDRDSTELAHAFIDAGYQAVLTCVDTHALDIEYAGRAFDEQFLRDLPPDVDPCGENGEFHTFVWDGPLLKRPIAWTEGEKILRDERFGYCDLVPSYTSASRSTSAG